MLPARQAPRVGTTLFVDTDGDDHAEVVETSGGRWWHVEQDRVVPLGGADAAGARYTP